MILGHGDIASVIPDRDDRLYFAAGVSNSRETRESEYEREKRLLLTQPHYPEGKHLIYFSSLSVFYADTRYTRHKREMEKTVQYNFHPCTIIRLGNITWGTNPYTLINYMRNKTLNHEKFEIQDVYRYIVTKEEFLYWINLIPEWSCEMNIIGRTMKVKDIYREYCYPWGKFDGPVKHDNSEQELQICV